MSGKSILEVFVHLDLEFFLPDLKSSSSDLVFMRLPDLSEMKIDVVLKSRYLFKVLHITVKAILKHIREAPLDLVESELLLR